MSGYGDVPYGDTPYKDDGAVLVCAFSGDPLNGYGKVVVQFTDLSTGNPDSWDWDFGDGAAISHAQNPEHTFGIGTFSVTLTVHNGTDTATLTKNNYVLVKQFTGTNLLIEQFRVDRPNIGKVLEACQEQFADLLTQLERLSSANNLDNISGSELDREGSIVGAKRTTTDDVVYRNNIRFQAFLNTSRGNPETLISATKVLTGATLVHYKEFSPAHVVLTTNATGVNVSEVFEKLKQIKPAGVSLTLTINPSTNPFVFAGEGGVPSPFPDGRGFAELGYSAIHGGHLSELII